jgi:hypothetical protein
MTQSVTALEPHEDPRNIDHYRRENSFWKSLTLIDLDRGRDVATVRFYGSGATVYCVAWLHFWNYSPDKAGRGYGKAGGGGYHKPSAAMQEALERAGVWLAEPIAGRGDSAMHEAMHAIAERLGIARPYVSIAHA